MAKQVSYQYSFPAIGTTPVETPWVDAAGYQKITTQGKLENAGASGTIEVFATGLTSEGKPDESSKYIISMSAGLLNSWNAYNAQLVTHYIKLRVSCGIGGPSPATVAVTLQGKEDAR